MEYADIRLSPFRVTYMDTYMGVAYRDTYTWSMLTFVFLLSESHTWSHIHGYLHGSHVYGYIYMEYADVGLSPFRLPRGQAR